MFKLINKLVEKLSNLFNDDNDSIVSEPEFLGEYWVYYGTKGYSVVYAKSPNEAKYIAISSKDCSVPADKVYPIYKRMSSVKNPAYEG